MRSAEKSSVKHVILELSINNKIFLATKFKTNPLYNQDKSFTLSILYRYQERLS